MAILDKAPVSTGAERQSSPGSLDHTPTSIASIEERRASRGSTLPEESRDVSSLSPFLEASGDVVITGVNDTDNTVHHASNTIGVHSPVTPDEVTATIKKLGKDPLDFARKRAA